MIWIYTWDQRRGEPWQLEVGGCRDWGQRLYAGTGGDYIGKRRRVGGSKRHER